MVAGIVLFALGLKTTIGHVDAPLSTVAALGLCGGVALYLLAHVALRLRIGGGLGRGRPVATVVLLGLFLVAREVPALFALALVAAICAALIAYEVLAHRESRALIRSRRGAFTIEEVSQVEPPRGRARRRARRSSEAAEERERST
jgi:low temperature requirement protein LtrA